ERWSWRLGRREDLAGVDQLGVPDLVAVGEVYVGVSHAGAVSLAGDAPEAVPRLHDDAPRRELRLWPGRALERKLDPAGDPAASGELIHPEPVHARGDG